MPSMDLKPNKSIDIRSEETELLDKQNKELNKKISAMIKEMHGLQTELHLKDQEVLRLKRIKEYKKFPEPKAKSAKPRVFEKTTQTPFSQVQSKQARFFLSERFSDHQDRQQFYNLQADVESHQEYLDYIRQLEDEIALLQEEVARA